MVASIIKTLIKNLPLDASDKHFNYVSRTKYITTKVRFQTHNNIAANENTL